MPADCRAIAGISIDRGAKLDGTIYGRYKKIGQLFYDFDHHKPSILLRGFKYGLLIAFPYQQSDKFPYIEGDITIPIPTARPKDGEVERKIYQWLGWITTDVSDLTGMVSYQIVLEVDPWPLVMARRFRQFENKTKSGESAHVVNGLWLYLNEGYDHKEDCAEKDKQQTATQA